MLIALVVLALAATFIGGFLPTAFLSRPGMWRLFAFRSGLLISVTFFDLLPEAWVHQPTWASWGALSAFLLFFAAESFAMVDACPEYMEECKTHALGWAALAGLFVHSFMDGFNLSVSFAAGTAAGLTVGTAMCLHKLADGLTLTSLFGQAGYGRGKSLIGLSVVAAATPLGVLLALHSAAAMSSAAAAGVLGFAAGSFLYVSAREILPRLHRNQDSGVLICFGAGILSMLALKRLSGG